MKSNEKKKCEFAFLIGERILMNIDENDSTYDVLRKIDDEGQSWLVLSVIDFPSYKRMIAGEPIFINKIFLRVLFWVDEQTDSSVELDPEKPIIPQIRSEISEVNEPEVFTIYICPRLFD